MRRFTEEEDQFLKDNFFELSLNKLADKLRRPMGSVAGRTRLLGLVLPDEIKRKRHEESFKRLAESGKTHRFKKGNSPHNKGKKMRSDVYKRCEATMFKPGQLPHNTVHFGKPYLHIRKRKNGYTEKVWMIQVDRKRRSYMTYLCVVNGIDMTGKKPVLKPGFDHSRPPEMKDIEILSNARNMLNNSIHRYPDELVSLIQTKAVLKRQINKMQENE